MCKCVHCSIKLRIYSHQDYECAAKSGWTWIKHFLSFSLRLSFFQRFFVNEAYWQSPDGPVFLFIGGEGPIYEFDVLAGTVGCSACPHLSSHTFEQQIGWKRKRENAWMNKGSVWHSITGLEMKMETVSGASCCVSVRRHFANTFFTFHSVRTRYQISQRLHRPHIYLLFLFWISIQPFFTVFQLGILLHAYSWHFCLCKMSSLQYKVDVKENQTIYQHRRNRCTQKSLHVAHHVIYSQDIYEGYLQQLIFSVLMGQGVCKCCASSSTYTFDML